MFQPLVMKGDSRSSHRILSRATIAIVVNRFNRIHRRMKIIREKLFMNDVHPIGIKRDADKYHGINTPDSEENAPCSFTKRIHESRVTKVTNIPTARATPVIIIPLSLPASAMISPPPVSISPTLPLPPFIPLFYPSAPFFHPVSAVSSLPVSGAPPRTSSHTLGRFSFTLQERARHPSRSREEHRDASLRSSPTYANVVVVVAVTIAAVALVVVGSSSAVRNNRLRSLSTADYRESVEARVSRKGHLRLVNPSSRSRRDHEGTAGARHADEIVYDEEAGWLAGWLAGASRFIPGAPRVGLFLSFERGKASRSIGQLVCVFAVVFAVSRCDRAGCGPGWWRHRAWHPSDHRRVLGGCIPVPRSPWTRGICPRPPQACRLLCGEMPTLSAERHPFIIPRYHRDIPLPMIDMLMLREYTHDVCPTAGLSSRLSCMAILEKKKIIFVFFVRSASWLSCVPKIKRKL